jgi:hypothetical protein
MMGRNSFTLSLALALALSLMRFNKHRLGRRGGEIRHLWWLKTLQSLNLLALFFHSSVFLLCSSDCSFKSSSYIFFFLSFFRSRFDLLSYIILALCTGFEWLE